MILTWTIIQAEFIGGGWRAAAPSLWRQNNAIVLQQDACAHDAAESSAASRWVRARVVSCSDLQPPLATPPSSPIISHPSFANPEKHPVCCLVERCQCTPHVCRQLAAQHVSVSLLAHPFDYESQQVKLWLKWKQWSGNDLSKSYQC